MDDELVDVRIEPKFYIPDGKPYDGGWCRPQTDGPGSATFCPKLKDGLGLLVKGNENVRMI